MKHLRIQLIILMLLMAMAVSAQQDPVIKRKRFYHTDNGFGVAWRAVHEGDNYYRAGLGTYNLALEKYFIAYDYNEANAALNYKIGVCYLFTGKDREKALEYIKKAYDLDPYVATDINYLLGRAYHLNLAFEDAIKEYNTYLSSLTEKKASKLTIDIPKLVTECKHGQELIMNPKRIILSNLGKSINSIYDDYSPVFHPDKKTIYFTSRRPNTTKGRRCPVDNKFYEDVYGSKLDKKDEYAESENMGTTINTKHNDCIVALSHNGTKMYIYNGDESGGDIRVSSLKDGVYRKPKKLPRVLRGKSRETSCFMTMDNKKFFFVSNREDNTIGGKDIFMSKKDERDRWSEPQNLGEKINTKYDEEAIFLDPTGDTLYFSSKGHNSMGGFDVFRTHRDAEGNWTEPVNLGYPVNTPDDDMFYQPAGVAKQAYISTVRDEGMGGFDIYKLTYLGAEKEFILSTEDDTLAWFHKPLWDLFYKKPQKLEVDTTLYLMGTITDASTSQPIVAKLQLIDRDKSQVAGLTVSESTGNYKIKLTAKKAFGVELNATGYMFKIDTIDLSREQFMNDVAIRNFTMDKVEVGAKMVLKNIYFDTGKATLKTESYPELNRVAQFLKDNASLRIEISGHTDNVGGFQYNKKLSKERAKSVVEYLIGNGVEKGRLEYEGYAYDQPIAPNNTEEGRSMNRRVEFKILSTR